MVLTVAEKNWRKHEQKKAERAAERAVADVDSRNNNDNNNKVVPADDHPDVEIEYVAEPLFPNELQNPGNIIVDRVGESEDSAIIDEDLREVMRRFHDQSSVAYITEDEGRLMADGGDSSEDIIYADDADNDDDGTSEISKQKLK